MVTNYTDLGHTPYYQVKDWERLFTVQQFGQLTDENIFFAIEYFITKVLRCWSLSNIYYNGKGVYIPPDWNAD